MDGRVKSLLKITWSNRIWLKELKHHLVTSVADNKALGHDVLVEIVLDKIQLDQLDVAVTSMRDLLRSRNLWWENSKLKVDSIERTLLRQTWDHQGSYLEITIRTHRTTRTKIRAKVQKIPDNPRQIQLLERGPKFLLKNAQQLSVSKIWASQKKSQSLRHNPSWKDHKAKSA